MTAGSAAAPRQTVLFLRFKDNGKEWGERCYEKVGKRLVRFCCFVFILRCVMKSGGKESGSKILVVVIVDIDCV
jgi:hypothetical protein